MTERRVTDRVSDPAPTASSVPETSSGAAAQPEAAATLPPPPERSWQQSAALALAAVALVLGLAWVVARAQSPYPFYGSVVNNREPAYTFSGISGTGETWTFQPQGKITLLFFGFTHCPDICPLTLRYLGEVRSRLTPQEQARTQVLFVSVDPERDTPEKIREYVEFFGEGVGLRVPEPELGRVAKSYGVAYGKVPVAGPLQYQINHTTATYLIDESGYTRVMWDYTQLTNVDRILRDVRYVMNHPRSSAAQAASAATFPSAFPSVLSTAVIP